MLRQHEDFQISVWKLGACSVQQAGVPICRTVQNPGEMVVLQPGAFYASISMGLGTSESACFAPLDWVSQGTRCVSQLAQRHAQSVFCHDQLLLAVSLHRCTPCRNDHEADASCLS